jgi:uncharacterized membrane protein YsdA (DUF1294 family)
MDRETSHFIASNLVYLFASPCILAYLLFAWDKHLAYYHRARVPEALLFLVSALFGAFGSLCAMIFFRHKTKHKSFLITIPLLAIIQVALIVVLKVYLLK